MKSNFIKSNRLFYTWIILVSLLFGLSVTISNYVNLPVNSSRDIILLAFHWCYIVFSTFILIYVLSLNKWIFTILFPVLILLSSIMAYYTFKFDITINSAILESTFNTTADEASGVLTWQMILYVFLLLITSILIVYLRFTKIKIRQPLIHIAIILIGIAGVRIVNKIRYNTLNYRIPFSLVYASNQYIREVKQLKLDKIDISEDANTSTDSLTVVFVVGEALRADHVGLNGYERNTTPLLEKENTISFSNIFSEFTHTNTSLPHIFTRSDSISKKPLYEESSFISIFNKCGYFTAWIGNQAPNKSYKYYVNATDTVILNKPYQSVYNLSKKLDEDLIPHLNNLRVLQDSKKLIIVHQIGSHWFYPSHYPDSFDIFKPAIDRKNFTNDDQPKMINAYDNTILYTDYVLSEIIQLLKNEKAVLIYLSDHGEVLGEDGKWLHAQETIYEKNPACFVWFSEKYKNMNPGIYQKTVNNQHKRFRTDFLFHSIIDVAEIQTMHLDTSLSIFK